MYRGIVREVMEIDGFPYGQLKEFVEKLQQGKSFLINGQPITLQVKDIDECINLIDKKSADEIKSTISGRSDDDNIKIILLHAYWLWYFPFKFKIEKSLDFFGKNLLGVIPQKYLYNEKGTGQIGQAASQVHNEVKWILENVFKKISACSNYDDFKGKFIDQWKKDDASVLTKNILLHIMDPLYFEPIAVTNEKKKIVEAFSSLTNATVIDDALKDIRAQLNIGDTSFYDNTIRPFWDTPEQSINVDKDGNLPLDVLLKFKKAIVLYGPPGTSKTFTARKLAKKIISIDFAEKYKGQGDRYSDFFKNARTIFGEKEEIPIGHADPSQNEIKPHIHRLQLHPNYTYDDFIAGKTITEENGKTEIKTQNGYLLKLIDDISKDESAYKDLPHIVILDEINRVDISRVFGELFTAMEPGYRKEGVDLPLTDNGGTPLKLKVPENLYFIGTMNLIDFSLEQVDFALRRRFAWVKRNYNEGKLKIILDNKINDNEIVDIDEDTVSNYIKKCSALNDKISNQSNLGPAYQIGHTFFAEVIDIYKELRGNKQDNDKKIWNSSVEFLWNISIKPMIEAYCGTMDSEAQENFIKDCKDAFCPKSEEQKK